MIELSIKPTKQALEEALNLSEEILKNIELNEAPLAQIALKATRLARLLNDIEMQKVFTYEVSGYPINHDGPTPEQSKLVIKAGRHWTTKDRKTGQVKTYFFNESIEMLENIVKSADAALKAAQDSDVSISSANPEQYLLTPWGNSSERKGIRQEAQIASKRLSSRRTLIYNYALAKHYELKFSGIADDIFSRIRNRVDSAIGDLVPDGVKILSAVYENLRSDNDEDWSNAVHSCRRLLQDLADAVFPPQSDRTTERDGNQKKIKLGKENYINRIVAFVEDRSGSRRSSSIIGSHLHYLGDRLDSVFQAAQKGSHDKIVTREEADRYVVFTYLLVGDILSLL